MDGHLFWSEDQIYEWNCWCNTRIVQIKKKRDIITVGKRERSETWIETGSSNGLGRWRWWWSCVGPKRWKRNYFRKLKSNYRWKIKGIHVNNQFQGCFSTARFIRSAEEEEEDGMDRYKGQRNSCLVHSFEVHRRTIRSRSSKLNYQLLHVSSFMFKL